MVEGYLGRGRQAHGGSLKYLVEEGRYERAAATVPNDGGIWTKCGDAAATSNW